VVVFMLAAISLPENIYLFLHNLRYSRTPAALFDPSDVTRGLIRGFSAFAFLVIALWVWHRPGEAPGNRGIEACPKW